MGAKKDDDGELLHSFMRIGLNEKTAKNTLVNAKLSANLAAVIDEVCSSFRGSFALLLSPFPLFIR